MLHTETKFEIRTLQRCPLYRNIIAEGVCPDKYHSQRMQEGKFYKNPLQIGNWGRKAKYSFTLCVGHMAVTEPITLSLCPWGCRQNRLEEEAY